MMIVIILKLLLIHLVFVQIKAYHSKSLYHIICIDHWMDIFFFFTSGERHIALVKKLHQVNGLPDLVSEASILSIIDEQLIMWHLTLILTHKTYTFFTRDVVIRIRLRINLESVGLIFHTRLLWMRITSSLNKLSQTNFPNVSVSFFLLLLF